MSENKKAEATKATEANESQAILAKLVQRMVANEKRTMTALLESAKDATAYCVLALATVAEGENPNPVIAKAVTEVDEALESAGVGLTFNCHYLLQLNGLAILLADSETAIDSLMPTKARALCALVERKSNKAIDGRLDYGWKANVKADEAEALVDSIASGELSKVETVKAVKAVEAGATAEQSVQFASGKAVELPDEVAKRLPSASTDSDGKTSTEAKATEAKVKGALAKVTDSDERKRVFGALASNGGISAADVCAALAQWTKAKDVKAVQRVYNFAGVCLAKLQAKADAKGSKAKETETAAA